MEEVVEYFDDVVYENKSSFVRYNKLSKNFEDTDFTQRINMNNKLNVRNEIKKNQKHLNDLKKDIDLLNQEKEKIKNEINDLNNEIKDLNIEIEDLNIEIKDLNIEIKDLNIEKKRFRK